MTTSTVPSVEPGEGLARLLVGLEATEGTQVHGEPGEALAKVSRCCFTSSVVGTSIATCLPSCTALNAARTATSVLP